MKTFIRIAPIALILLAMLACKQKEQSRHEKSPALPDSLIICEKADSLVFEKLRQKAIYRHWNVLSPRDRLLNIAQFFKGKPYRSKTLEITGGEHLVANLQALDCTTYIESVLALERTLRDTTRGFGHFLRNLETIRYRGGKLRDYPSRLHYFSDWIYDNVSKSIVQDVSCDIGGKPIRYAVNFMSTHPGSYAPLRDTNVLATIAGQEAAIAQRDYCYIPQDEIAQHTDQLQAGDIIGLTTSIEGLDIAHLGLVEPGWDGHFHLLHASGTAGKVLQSEKPLAGYVSDVPHFTGIMVLRVAE